MRIVIVGHGRSPEGKGWGAEIDSYDIVVRMWNWEWQPEADYGTKYDIGYLEVSPKQMARFNEYNSRTPKSWIAGQLRSDPVPLPPNTYVIPISKISEWADIGISLGGMGLSGRLAYQRGTVIACHMIEGMINSDELVLVGFDNVYEKRALTPEEGFSEIYRNAPSCAPFKRYVGGGTKFHNHDYVAEHDVLMTLAERRNARVFYAQDVW